MMSQKERSAASPSGPVPSLFATLTDAAMQLGAGEVTAEGWVTLTLDDEQGPLNELVLIVAEIYAMDPDRRISIGGVPMPASQVQAVYRMLTPDHAEWVLGKFRQVHGRIRCAKWYLQTMLYNVVFEMHGDLENLYQSR